MREIPQRELRNHIGRVLREVAAGETVRVTVRGVPVAELTPLREDPGPERFVSRERLARAFGDVQLDEGAQADLLADVRAAVDDDPRDPWE